MKTKNHAKILKLSEKLLDWQNKEFQKQLFNCQLVHVQEKILTNVWMSSVCAQKWVLSQLVQTTSQRSFTKIHRTSSSNWQKFSLTLNQNQKLNVLILLTWLMHFSCCKRRNCWNSQFTSTLFSELLVDVQELLKPCNSWLIKFQKDAPGPSLVLENAKWVLLQQQLQWEETSEVWNFHFCFHLQFSINQQIIFLSFNSQSLTVGVEDNINLPEGKMASNEDFGSQFFVFFLLWMIIVWLTQHSLQKYQKFNN